VPIIFKKRRNHFINFVKGSWGVIWSNLVLLFLKHKTCSVWVIRRVICLNACYRCVSEFRITINWICRGLSDPGDITFVVNINCLRIQFEKFIIMVKHYHLFLFFLNNLGYYPWLLKFICLLDYLLVIWICLDMFDWPGSLDRFSIHLYNGRSDSWV
jgi:hypothetical protein